MRDMTVDARPAYLRYTTGRRLAFLAILFLVSMWNYVDRQLMSVLLEPIKTEFRVSDAQMGLLTGFAFAFSYATIGVPVARLSDRGDRRLIITLAVTVWSVFTALCGLARGFTQLALIRIGVGVGEAGALPPAQSLIADYFPPEQRTKALAVFMASAMVGNFIAFIAGARLAAAFGWRMAFIALGLPGLLIALATLIVLREPRKAAAQARTAEIHEPFINTLRALAGKRTYVLITLSMVLYFLVAYGATAWFPAYLGRVMKMSLADIGSVYGPLAAVSAFIGTLLGGVITDWLAVRDQRWLGWIPAIALLLCFPVLEFGLSSGNLTRFIAAACFGAVAINAALPGLFSMLHVVCGSARRAMAVAVLYFFSNLLGLGLGPLITGLLSDHFRHDYGPASLRIALMVACLFLIPASLSLWLGGRRIERDQEA